MIENRKFLGKYIYILIFVYTYWYIDGSFTKNSKEKKNTINEVIYLIQHFFI